jgi:putative addiction module component (TIGR02574 family)
MAVESLTDEALALPAAERLRLVQRLWESLHATLQADPDALPLTDEQLQALDRRAAEMERDPRLGASWEAVKARLSPKP